MSLSGQSPEHWKPFLVKNLSIAFFFRVSSKKLNRHILTPMNVGQLQVILNYLLTQIETLNENLVEYLITRDELAIEQVILSFIKEAVRLAYVSNFQYIPWDLDYRRVQFSNSIEGYPSFDIFATCEFSSLRSSDFVREVRDKIGYIFSRRFDFDHLSFWTARDQYFRKNNNINLY